MTHKILQVAHTVPCNMIQAETVFDKILLDPSPTDIGGLQDFVKTVSEKLSPRTDEADSSVSDGLNAQGDSSGKGQYPCDPNPQSGRPVHNPEPADNSRPGSRC